MKSKVKAINGSNLENLKRELKEANELNEIISRGKYQWQATFDAISDPVMIITKDYKIVRANIGLAKIANKDVRSIIGEKCYQVFAGRKKACEGCPIKQVIKEKKNLSNRLEEDIHKHDYIVNAFPFMDEVDNAESIVVHYRDITLEKRLQQELVQQEKMAAIGMLAGGVAHEINNPLGGIIAFSQLIRRELDEDNSMYADIEEIERAAMRCKKIVQDLLDFSRMSSGKKKQWVDINPLIEKVIPFIKMELKSLNIELLTGLDPKLPRVYGDINRLEQVLLNLLTNACHSMTRGGKLMVRTYDKSKNSEVCIEVADTGCGIDDSDLSRIFDPFFTTKLPGKGTGLGLSISYRIVRDHGGRIKVSSHKDKGSCFVVCLPSVRNGKDEKINIKNGGVS